MIQSGFLYKQDPKDYVLGVNSPLKGEDLNPNGDWIAQKPSHKKKNMRWVGMFFVAVHFQAPAI